MTGDAQMKTILYLTPHEFALLRKKADLDDAIQKLQNEGTELMKDNQWPTLGAFHDAKPENVVVESVSPADVCALYLRLFPKR
jgi:hypothetical protein